MKNNVCGFSLVQLLIVIAIVAIVASQSLGSFATVLKTYHLKGAIQSVYFLMQSARHHAVAKQQNMVVDISTGPQWCMGITDQADCDCLIANSCTVDGVEKVIAHHQFRFTDVTASTFTHDNQARFAPPRGLAEGYAGAVTLTNSLQIFKVILSNTGRVRICTLTSPVHPYSTC